MNSLQQALIPMLRNHFAGLARQEELKRANEAREKEEARQRATAGVLPALPVERKLSDWEKELARLGYKPQDVVEREGIIASRQDQVQAKTKAQEQAKNVAYGRAKAQEPEIFWAMKAQMTQKHREEVFRAQCAKERRANPTVLSKEEQELHRQLKVEGRKARNQGHNGPPMGKPGEMFRMMDLSIVRGKAVAGLTDHGKRR